MNRRIDFTNLGGFPATQFTLDFMQRSYRDAISALATLAGNQVIVKGVENNNGIVTDGWIVWAGEILFFQGGPYQSTFIVEDITETRKFLNDSIRQVYFTRIARFAAGGERFDTLRRISNIPAIEDLLKNMQETLTQQINKMWKVGDIIEIDVTAEYLAQNFDSTGRGINERLGWAICNGQNSTRNRGGRFAVGYDPTRADYNLLGKIGGQEFVALTVAQMPAHSHTFFKGGDRKLDIAPNHTVVESNFDHWGEFDAGMNTAGGSQSHENRPPYFVTIWIKKIN